MPSEQGDEIVRKLVDSIRTVISSLIPGVEVTGFASGNPKRGRAFGVAVPDVDVVVSVSPEALIKALQLRLQSSNGRPVALDARKLQKSAIRACTDQLVSAGGFKFRRSAFKGQEPKVTLLAPLSAGAGDLIPIDFSVNTATPLHNAALLTECGQLESRAKELILLVHRWARDRGISHAAKGHLPPYAWSLVSIYFLQVADTVGRKAYLPSLEGFEKASALARAAAASQGHASAPTAEQQYLELPDNLLEPLQGVEATTGQLLKDFFQFYNSMYNWRNEAVCVRLGRRAPPPLELPLHIVLSEGGKTPEVAPSIEDPFDVSRNLGSFMTEVGIARLKEELSRATSLCDRGGTLSELLEPWAPPELDVAGAEPQLDE